MPSSHTRHDQGETSKTQHVSTVWADGTSHHRKGPQSPTLTHTPPVQFPVQQPRCDGVEIHRDHPTNEDYSAVTDGGATFAMLGFVLAFLVVSRRIGGPKKIIP